MVHQWRLSMKVVRSQLVTSGGGVGTGLQVRPSSNDSTWSDKPPPPLQLAIAITPFPGISSTDEKQIDGRLAPSGSSRSCHDPPLSAVKRTAGSPPPTPSHPS